MTGPALPAPGGVRCARQLVVLALTDVPIVAPGDDLVRIVTHAIRAAGETLQPCDVVCVTSKLLSRAEGRFVDLSTLNVSDEARLLGDEIGKDSRIVELILRESTAVSRKAPNVLVTRHRLGFISANAGIDASNARPPGASEESGPWALCLPGDPDASAETLRAALAAEFGVPVGVVVTDSFGRPFRNGTVGAAVGVAGLPAVFDQRGKIDLFGRTLEATITGVADQVAAAADLVSGQADEGRPITVVRGLSFEPVASSARDLLRPPGTDLYA